MCATLTNLTVKLDQNTQGNQRLTQKIIAIQQRIEEMGNEVKVEVGRSIDSLGNHFGERLEEESNVRNDC